MPKDNENIPLFDVGELAPTEPQGFTPDQMVLCEVCGRANPPTRVNCLYCGSTFPFDEKKASQQKPALKALERGQAGYSNILLPSANVPSSAVLNQAASLLKLPIDQLVKIFSTHVQLPLALTATVDEALLVEKLLKDLGVETKIVSDANLHIEDLPTVRLRAAEFRDDGMMVHQTGSEKTIFVKWSELFLLVSGRLVSKSLEVRERRSTRAENQILESSETSADEAVLDIYCRDNFASLRIGAHSFDFTCLGDQKGLLAEKNLSTITDSLCKLTPHLSVDSSYRSVRQALDFVWRPESQTDSRGWRRERPGKYSIGALTEISNESQFTRYSRLRFYLSVAPHQP